MPLEQSPNSRFQLTPPILHDGIETYGKWVRPSFLTRDLGPDEVTSVQIDASYQGRPDLIAYRYYGSPELDWVVIAYNNVRDVLNWPRAGTTIKLPIPALIAAELL